MKEKLNEKLNESVAAGAPYARRLLEDAELQKSLKSVLANAKGVYGELRGPQSALGVAARLASNGTLRGQVRDLLDGLQESHSRLLSGEPPEQEPAPSESEQGHQKRDLLLLGVALVGLGLVARRLFSADSD